RCDRGAGSYRRSINPAATAARPVPASETQRLFLLSHTWGLYDFARSSNTPCAPGLVSTGSHRLDGRFGSSGSSIIWLSYPVCERYQSAKAGASLLPTMAFRLGNPTTISRFSLYAAHMIASAMRSGWNIGGTGWAFRGSLLNTHRNCGVFTAGRWTMLIRTLLFAWSSSDRTESNMP